MRRAKRAITFGALDATDRTKRSLAESRSITVDVVDNVIRCAIPLAAS